ncbi:MAG: hypothetical protein COA78_21460 [Blastopirellula sp.]|nr:MAG: hypothetical protein COA78_21460 [Blastopirellula sp.]
MLKRLLSLFGSGKSTETPVTLDALQGKWRMFSVGKNGNFAPPGVAYKAKIYMVIKGNAYQTITDGTPGDQGKIQLDESAKPVHFDQHITKGESAGDIHLGIVRICDGVLENCQGDAGNPRPKNFDKQRNDNASLASFKRVGD